MKGWLLVLTACAHTAPAALAPGDPAGAKLALFEHSGHMAHLEETQRFVEVVSQFVHDLR